MEKTRLQRGIFGFSGRPRRQPSAAVFPRKSEKSKGWVERRGIFPFFAFSLPACFRRIFRAIRLRVKGKHGGKPVFRKNKSNKMKKTLDKRKAICYNKKAVDDFHRKPTGGGIAQLARAFGSYPTGRRFKSHFRYQARWSRG